jgi:hypothetical protein
MTPTLLINNVYSVEVPEGAENFRILKFSQPQTFSYDYSIRKGDRCTKGLIAMVNLPPGSWQLIGHVNDITEELAATIVERDGDGYKDYSGGFHHDLPFPNAIASLNSLLTSKALDPNKNYVLLKKQP